MREQLGVVDGVMVAGPPITTRRCCLRVDPEFSARRRRLQDCSTWWRVSALLSRRSLREASDVVDDRHMLGLFRGTAGPRARTVGG